MDDLHNTCPICQAPFQEMIEPTTTSCGHPYCWPCIHTWLEDRRAGYTAGEELIEHARRCPKCRKPIYSLIPLFGFGKCRAQDEDVPRRPTEVIDPFADVPPPPSPPSSPPSHSAFPATPAPLRRSGRQPAPNRRYSDDGQEDPSEMSMESRRGRQDRRGGGVKRLRAGQDDGQAVHSTLASMRALSRDRVFTIGLNPAEPGGNRGAETAMAYRSGARSSSIETTYRIGVGEATGRGSGRGRGRGKSITRGGARASESSSWQDYGESEDEQDNEGDKDVEEEAKKTVALSSSTMPGSNRTYQEVSTEFVRDHMIQRQVQFRDIVAAQVVTEIRISFPEAWSGQKPGQAGKCLKTILSKAIKNRRNQKSIVSRSGVSGAKLSRLQSMTDEIIAFSYPPKKPEDGEYMASEKRKMTAEEKKAKGKELRALSCVASGPGRSREPRIDTVFKDGLEKLATGVEKKLQAENLARGELQERKEAREALKEAKEKEEREEKRREREREDRKEQMNHCFQMKLLEAMTTSSKSEAPVRQHTQEERIELNLKKKEEEEDSESFPTKIFCSNFDQLVTGLRDFCNIGTDKQVKVILFKMSRILDLVLLETGKTYYIDFKEKEQYVRIFMD